MLHDSHQHQYPGQRSGIYRQPHAAEARPRLTLRTATFQIYSCKSRSYRNSRTMQSLHLSSYLPQNVLTILISECSAKQNSTKKTNAQRSTRVFSCCCNATMRPAGRGKYRKRRSGFRYALQRDREWFSETDAHSKGVVATEVGVDADTAVGATRGSPTTCGGRRIRIEQILHVEVDFGLRGATV
jgi:hypothetical protein